MKKSNTVLYAQEVRKLVFILKYLIKNAFLIAEAKIVFFLFYGFPNYLNVREQMCYNSIEKVPLI